MEKTNDAKKYRYSFIYSKLVEDSSDFVGLVAYSLYKNEKIRYIKQFEEENKKTPEPWELKEFNKIAENHITTYRENAEKRVTDFFNNLYRERFEQLEQENAQQLSCEIKKINPSNLKSFLIGVAASLVATILSGLIILGYFFSQHGTKVLHDFFLKFE